MLKCTHFNCSILRTLLKFKAKLKTFSRLYNPKKLKTLEIRFLNISMFLQKKKQKKKCLKFIKGKTCIFFKMSTKHQLLMMCHFVVNG